jgi:probable F420-dependent oxidoreductase
MKLGILFNTDRLNSKELCNYALEVERIGLDCLWLPELFTRDPFATAGFFLAKTEQLTVATGIATIYARDPTAAVSSASALQELSDGRFILGLGVSNAGLNRTRGHEWQKPLGKLTQYLEAMKSVQLTSAQVSAPINVAAHGPKMLEIASTKADGANTYLMPSEHVSAARQILGKESDLNTMLFCLRETDQDTARRTARKAIAYYVGLDYYQKAWKNFGFTEADFAEGGSDRLVDSLVVWGDPAKIKDRISLQFKLGATQVVIIPIGSKVKGHPDWELLKNIKSDF